MGRHCYRLAGLLVAGVFVLAPQSASAQRATLSVDSSELFTSMPFVLSITAEGFQQDPEPSVSQLEINGCTVTYLGSLQNVSRRTGEVSFIFRYRVQASQSGTYEIPAIEVVQGTAVAKTRPAQFNVRDINTTADMQLRIGLPDRPVWLGEVFEVTIDWYLRRDPNDPSFVIPLFDDEAAFEIKQSPGPSGRRTVTFTVGAGELELPYETEKTKLDGIDYTRFRFRVLVTPKQPGTIELERALVVARLQTGVRRGTFGFRRPVRSIFKAEDKTRTLDVRPLPAQGRPASFSNAVGTSYSIEARASRTVVRVGEPIELDVLIRGDSTLEGLSLPRLDGVGGLDPRLFDVADEQPPGRLSDDGKAKRFKVTVRLESSEAREIPAIAFSYFDPKKTEYVTVKSQPIALSVAGSAVVGAEDVVTTQGSRRSDGARGPQTLVGADLSLSDPKDTLDAAFLSSREIPLVAALYMLPLLVFGIRFWQVRSRDSRGKSSALRDKVKELRSAVAAAAEAPARDGAPKIVAGLRALARELGRDLEGIGELIADIETTAFDPNASSKPLDGALCDRANAIASAALRAPGRPAIAASALVWIGLASMLAPAIALAQTNDPLAAARIAYGNALEQSEPGVRARGFTSAESLFRQAVADNARRPELLTDWGNAALGAGDIGRAILAYRRALSIDPSLTRAEINLSWVRQRVPSWVPKPTKSGAMDSLFFWHGTMSRAKRLALGATAFALAVLMMAPWSARRTKLLRRFAIVPALVWIAMTTSAVLDRDQSHDAVVIADGVVLRSADSPGAPAALASPLPAGAEAVIVESRDTWLRVELADGTAGWMPSGTLEHVVRKID